MVDSNKPRIDDDTLSRLIREAIETFGVQRTAAALNLGAEATCRLGGGLRTQAGTRSHARANLGQLATLKNGAT